MRTVLSRVRPLAQEAISHWKEHLPNKYQKLKAAGRLEAEATRAADRTLDEQASLMEQGYPPEEAWAVVREQYLFQPEEEGASEEAPPTEQYQDARTVQAMLNKYLQEE